MGFFDWLTGDGDKEKEDEQQQPHQPFYCPYCGNENCTCPDEDSNTYTNGSIGGGSGNAGF